MAFLSSPGSTNKVDTATIQVSTISTPVSTISSHDNTANLSDATITGKKITINGSDTAGYDKTKIHLPKQMVAINGAGFDWSYMADDEVPTNMALMAFSDSENEVMFCDHISVLKRDASFRDSEINALKLQIEKLKKEKESNQIKIYNFENASKSLDKLIGSQISDNSRTGLGFTSYNAITPPPTGLFAPLIIDLSNSGLEEFQHPEFEGYGPKASKSVCVDTSNEIKKAHDAPIIEDWVLDSDDDEYEVMVLKIDNVQHKLEQANQPRKMAQKLVLKNVEKGTGQRKVRPVWNNSMRINHQNFSNSKRNFAPTAVLTKSGIVPVSTARQSSSRAASPMSAARPINIGTPKPLVNVVKPRQNALQKSHLLFKRPFYQQTTIKNINLNNKVNTAKVNSINTAKGNRLTSAVGKQGINVVKSSTCWVWRPKINVQDHVSKNSGSCICVPQDALKDQGYFDNGCSRHMTGNISYLTDFKEHDGGYVAFRRGEKGGKISRKGTIKTGKLDFKDVYFVKELQINLFSVSHMCDKKNSVLFTDTECFVLSPNFKLADESHVLLKVPRKNNMYSFDIKNIVPQKDLTCLLAKATSDESMLWHKRLGHVNFKNINKLIKDNLVRGLPLKRFENDQTCVACEDYVILHTHKRD
nr:ribonuclease H-like domain-containing protein [Tanacetum cinerariifolium]